MTGRVCRVCPRRCLLQRRAAAEACRISGGALWFQTLPDTQHQRCRGSTHQAGQVHMRRATPSLALGLGLCVCVGWNGARQEGAPHCDRVRPSRRREAEGRAKERMRSARHTTPPRGPPAPHHPQRRRAHCGLAGRVVPGKRGNLKGGVGQGAKTRYSSKSRSCLQLPLFVDSLPRERERMSERAHAAW